MSVLELDAQVRGSYGYAVRDSYVVHDAQIYTPQSTLSSTLKFVAHIYIALVTRMYVVHDAYMCLPRSAFKSMAQVRGSYPYVVRD